MTKAKKKQTTPFTDSVEYNIGGVGPECWVVDAAHCRMWEVKATKLEKDLVALQHKLGSKK